MSRRGIQGDELSQDFVPIHRQRLREVGHGVKGGSGLCAGQCAGGGKDAAVNAASVSEQVANGYPKLFLLGSGGGR